MNFQKQWNQECSPILTKLQYLIKKQYQQLPILKQDNISAKQIITIYTYSFLNSFIYNRCIKKQFNKQNIISQFKKIIQKVITSFKLDDKQNLVTVAKKWMVILKFIKKVQKYFKYLERSDHNTKLNLKNEALNIFNQMFFSTQKSLDHIIKQTGKQLNQLRLNRQHIQVKNHLQTIKNIIRMIMKCTKAIPNSQNQNKNKIINQIISYSQTFYKEFFDLNKQKPANEYLSKIKNLIQFQNQVSQFCFQKIGYFQDKQQNQKLNMKQKLQRMMNRQLIQKFQQFFIKNQYGLINMLQKQDVYNLKLAYTLFSKIQNGFKKIKDIFFSHVRNLGIQIIMKRNDLAKQQPNEQKRKKIAIYDQNFIKDLIRFYKKMKILLDKGFQGFSQLKFAFNNAFGIILNAKIAGYQTSQMLSYSCNHIIEKACNNSFNNVEEVQNSLIDIIYLMDCLDDKDLFLAFQKYFLSMRLIKYRTETLYYEELLLKRLKISVGPNSTLPFEMMLYDVKQSENFDEEFKKTFKQYGQSIHVIIFNQTLVLSKANWPQFLQINIPIQKNIYLILQQYERYLKKYPPNDKKMFIWVHTCSTIQVKFTPNVNKSKNYLIKMSFLQYAIANFIDERKQKLNFDDIKDYLNSIKSELLQQTLQTMVNFNYQLNQKHKIITIEIINNKKYYLINQEFFYKQRNLNIARIPFNKPKAIQKVQVERDLTIQAVIMKIMKNKKIMHKKQLQNSVSTILQQFRPTLQQINKSISKLKQKEYIQQGQNEQLKYIV